MSKNFNDIEKILKDYIKEIEQEINNEQTKTLEFEEGNIMRYLDTETEDLLNGI